MKLVRFVYAGFSLGKGGHISFVAVDLGLIGGVTFLIILNLLLHVEGILVHISCLWFELVFDDMVLIFDYGFIRLAIFPQVVHDGIHFFRFGLEIGDGFERAFLHQIFVALYPLHVIGSSGFCAHELEPFEDVLLRS